MPRVQYYVASSIDGFIADLDENLGWLTSIEGGAEDTYKTFIATVGSLAIGASTYRWMLANASGWPYEGQPTWVFTNGELERFEGADIRFVSGPPVEHIDDMREAAGDLNVWLVGGADLASQFADAGLLDDLILTLAPAVLGDGISLFARGLPGHLRLAGTREFRSGMVELRYALR